METSSLKIQKCMVGGIDQGIAKDLVTIVTLHKFRYMENLRMNFGNLRYLEA